MRVTLLAHNLSNNCLSRTHLLAELLKDDFEIEVVGPQFGDSIWKPLADVYEYRGVETSPTPGGFLPDARKLWNLVSGDVIFARKPHLTSFGVGLVGSKFEGRPILVDIEDHESGFRMLGSRRGTHWRAVSELGDLHSYYYARIGERLVRYADGCTVSNRILQRKFGGLLLRHVRDAEQFSPDRFDQDALRAELGLPLETPLVVFAGTPRPHKGVRELVRATAKVDQDFKTVIVGASEDDPFTAELRRLGGPNLIIRGRQPFNEMPKWVAVGDIIAVPQRETKGTAGQNPSKLFEAMLMGKPIVTTNVSDIPEIINDAGIIVQPNSVTALANALSDLVTDAEKRAQLGRRARERAVTNFSYEVAKPKLVKLIYDVMEPSG